MFTARITKGHSSRPNTVVLRLDKDALDEIGTRIVLDRTRMTIRPASLDERMHLNLNRKTRATTIQVPHTSSVDEWVGDYWIKEHKDGNHYQLLRDDLEIEDLEMV